MKAHVDENAALRAEIRSLVTDIEKAVARSRSEGGADTISGGGVLNRLLRMLASDSAEHLDLVIQSIERVERLPPGSERVQ